MQVDRQALIDALTRNVPASLALRPQWLMWRFEKIDGKEKPAKVPYYLAGRRRTGGQGSDEDRSSLVTLTQALDRLNLDGRFAGVGFAFLPGDGLIGIDVDRAINADTGEIAPHLSEIVDRCNSYTELSPSGTGAHVIVAGDIKTFKDNDVGVEVFCGRQYFTFTGNRWGGSDEVAPLTEGTLAWLHDLVKGPAVQASAQVVQMPRPAAGNGAQRYCLAALDSAVQRMRSAGEGRRNKTLNAEAYGLAQLIHTGGISETVIRATLTEAAMQCGLGELEIKATLASGIRGGMESPRMLPERDPPRHATPIRQEVRRQVGSDDARVDDRPAPPLDDSDASSPPPSPENAPRARGKGKGLRRAPSRGEGDDKPEWFWPRVDMLTRRFTLIWTTDTAWDSVCCVLVKVQAMRIRFTSDVVRAWLNRVGIDEAPTVNPSDLVFEPGQQVPDHQINMFGGLPLQPVACSGDDVRPMLELLRHLVSATSTSSDDVDAVMHWILCWQAMPLQKVGTKMQTAIVMHGAQGTGKNLYWDLWRDLFGDYGITVGQTEIEDKFNGWVSRKLAIIGDEVVSRQEMYHNKNRLKSIVTQEVKFAIRGMMQETRWESNHANVVFLSNESQPLALEERDRRYMVIFTPLEADQKLYQSVRDFKAAGGAGKWLHYLQTYPLDDFDAHTKPIMTKAKADLIELNWKPPERFAYEWTEGFIDLPSRVCSAEQLYRAFRRWCDLQGERWPPSQAIFTKAVERWVTERCKRDAAGRLEPPSLTYKQIALKDSMSNRKTVRCWVPRGSEPPAGVTEGEWGYEAVQAFEADLARFCRRPGVLEADE